MHKLQVRHIAALLFTIGLSACGGGGGSTSPVVPSPTTAPSFNPPSQMNTYTSYTVYQGTAGDGFVYLEVMPLNVTPSDLTGAAAVPGAIIQYPDGTAQVTDVLGNFDAAQSAWATANQSQILSNPNLEPSVVALAPGTTLPPADATVQVYSASSNLVSAARPLAGATNELTAVSVFPRGYALFDTELRTYHAVGVDSDGTFTNLANATIAWSLTVPTGCSNAPAGKIAATSADPTRAIYTPPTTGTFPAGCQDLVTASVTANGGTFSGSGSAFYYDSSQGATVTGVLSDSTGKPVASGIVDLYGGGREFYHGKLYAIADSTGTFKRLVPPNRTLYPFAGNPTTAGGKTTYSFFTVNPATVNVTGAKTTVTQNLAETTTAAANPFKPLPPIERAVRDSWFAHDVAQDGLPFGGAGTGGTFPNGTLEKILNAPGPANASGTLTSGAFAQWTYKWDATGKIVVVQQPATQEGGRHVLQFTTGVATMAYGGACPSGSACFNFVEYYNPAGLTAALPSPLVVSSLPNGTIAANDGSFAQSVSSSAFNVAVTRNTYSAGHQTLGSPLYSHTGTYAQTPGSSTITINDSWSNANGKTIATYQGSRIAGSGTTLFTFSGSGTRTFYKPDGTQLAQVAFSVGNGTSNSDHSGGFAVTFTSGLPNPSDNGTVVTWTLNASGANRATGTVTNPNVTGLQTANVATFTLSNTLIVTVTTDPNLGGNTIAFHL